MRAPRRVQLRRSRGWAMPPNTLKVDRTTPWSNPFTAVECGGVAAAVALHGRWMRGDITAPGGALSPSPATLRSALRGRHLACWCPLDGPCHAELVLAIANAA